MNKSNFLQDGSGNFSATRLALLCWVIGVLLMWSYISIATGQLVKIDNSIVALIGVLMTGKVVQSFSPSDASAISSAITQNKVINKE